MEKLEDLQRVWHQLHLVKDEVYKMIVEKVAVTEVESCYGKPMKAEKEMVAGKLTAQGDQDDVEDQKVEDEVQEVVEEDEEEGEEVQQVEKDRQVSVEVQQDEKDQQVSVKVQQVELDQHVVKDQQVVLEKNVGVWWVVEVGVGAKMEVVVEVGMTELVMLAKVES